MLQPFDESARTFLRRWFECRVRRVETEAEVFTRARTTDIVTACEEEDRARLQGTIFAHFRQLNGVELKGFHDPLTVTDYNLILARAWALGAVAPKQRGEAADAGDDEASVDEGAWQIEPLPWNRTLTIVCVTRPDRILVDLREQMQFQPTGEPGVYFHGGQLPIWILYPTELVLDPRNYPLLPLARGEKLEQFINLCIRDGLTDYLQLAIDVGMITEPALIWRKILEVKQMQPIEISEDTWKVIDELFRISPHAPETLPSLQETLAEHERRGEARGEILAHQRILIDQLQRKFHGLPEAARRRIEATEDREQLWRWAEGVVEARSLEEMGLGE